MIRFTQIFCVSLYLILLTGCDSSVLNSPYPSEDKNANYLYGAFSLQPKHLDPAKAYSSDEYMFIGQIYEPILQYHYLKRPYQLVTLTAANMPEVTYYDKNGNTLPESADPKRIAYSDYLISIKPGIQYAPHPALAKDDFGDYLYHQLTEEAQEAIHSFSDFENSGTRELVASDYVYQIKRLAHPEVHSPILGIMQQQIVGLETLASELQQQYKKRNPHQNKPYYVDLNQYALSGVELVDKYTYKIRIKGKDPQFVYWLAMPFFSPMPWEADVFYAQAGLRDRNILLDWYPVGTGPYLLSVNNPNKEMVLAKNPNFHEERYPDEGMPGDKEKGLLQDAGKKLPFIDKVIFSLEKESIPRWSKFLQGYYDTSGIASDNFDQAVDVSTDGVELSQELKAKGIRLQTASSPTTMYWGFNMLDPVIGGTSERARLLRQAISIAVNMEEYIAIFLNGRATPASSPIPPGIFGHEKGKRGINQVVYEWDDDQLQRKDIQAAKALLVKAGYPNGIDTKTKKPLVLHYDVISSGGPDDKAQFAWFRKQFAKIDIQLDIRATQYNRFRDKIRQGTAQIYRWGWNADYPDPENFLFLLYGPSGKAKHGGENASNYDNARFNKLYEKMKDMQNTPERAAIIHKMVSILQTDAPWLWGFNPMSYKLSHQWNRIGLPNQMANNTVKYARIYPDKRAELREVWNQPNFWPVIFVVIFLLVSVTPVVISYRKKEYHRTKPRLQE